MFRIGGSELRVVARLDDLVRGRVWSRDRMMAAVGVSIVLLALPLAAAGASSSDASQPARISWPAIGGDHGNTRYSALSQINTANVHRMKGAWVKELEAVTRTPPVIAGDRMYISDAAAIYALDLKRGDTIWRFAPPDAAPSRGGVAVGEGLIFSGLSDSRIVALDQRTGKLVWTGFIGNAPLASVGSDARFSFGAGNPGFSKKVGFIANAPTYVNGMVISGLTGGDGGVRGKISALDAKTGKLAWDFFVIPSPGDPGSETWPASSDYVTRGGGAVWTEGAADKELGLVYYGTGNPVPPLGGEVRAGDNLYTASVVAIDVKTGKLKWHYQMTHHDIWEMDVATPVVLFTTVVDGRPRKALAAMRTDGYLFILDRATGKPIIPIEERPVKQDIRLRTAPTQPFPVGADRFGPSCADPATLLPGFVSGCYFDPIYYDSPNRLSPTITARQAPMSYDPGTGNFYVMGSLINFWYRRVDNPYALVSSFPPGTVEQGIYAAISARTNKIVWQKRSPWSLAMGSGALTTAGGLLFHMEGDGNFQASDAKTGQLLWQFQTGYLGAPVTGSNAGGVPAASYEFVGEQYVAVPMGRGLWTFKLGGTLPPREAQPAPPREFGFSGIVQQLADDGTGNISIGVLLSAIYTNGQEHYVDEYAFAPIRSRVKSGVNFHWTNLGVEPHTIVAKDGSWTTGLIRPGEVATLSIARSGTYEYFCKEHPWSKGELIVTSTDKASAIEGGTFTIEQANRGKHSFQLNCTNGCHMPDLTAGERAPALAGEAFLGHWASATAQDLFGRIRSTMPEQKPHSLSDQVYIDIVAFLLQANGLPSGDAELNSDAGILSTIPIKTPNGEH
jgi:quinohemoprotein ethanol dehydrogenase